jgi:hypothetical protein
MGRIVGGFATSHILMPSGDAEAAASRVFEGMMAMREEVKRLAPDVVVIANSDHMNNFNLAHQVSFAVGVADEFVPLGDMAIPLTPFRGCRALGEAFAKHAPSRGFDVVPAEEVRPDHAMMINKLVVAPNPQTPVLPVYINTNMPITPDLKRGYALGQAFCEVIEASDYDFGRVVVIGGGGLSHWLCDPQQGRVNEEFDRYFLDMMASGRSAELTKITVPQLQEAAGNGGLELANWLFMAGALPPSAKGEVVYYEPMPAWITGMGGLSLRAD